MSKFAPIFLIIFVILIFAHLFYSIDYNHLFTVGNKGGATGILISILGIIATILAYKAERSRKQTS
jgi:hypothetical protein